MKKAVLLAAALASSVALAGCGATQQDRTVGGAAIGAVGGAAIGAAATGGRASGAVLGALAGGATGAVIGANSSPGPDGGRCVRVRYDYYGNPYCTRYAY